MTAAISVHPAGVLDSAHLYEAVASLPEQLVEATSTARRAALQTPRTPRALVVAAMGAGAIAGDALRAIGTARLSVPIVSSESYALPAFVGPDTLVIAISYSGETSETLAMATSALERGSMLIAITAGGTLGTLARAAGAPVIALPASCRSSRAAFGAMVAILLVVAKAVGVDEGSATDIGDVVVTLAQRRDELVVDGGGVAGEIARHIERTFPLLHGVTGIGAVAARRWKAQINLNAKCPAFCAVEPGLGHDEISGFGQAGDVTRQILTLVRLHSDFDDDRTERHLAHSEEMLREVVADVLEVDARGTSELAQLLDLVLVGDFVSLQLAAREGIDPGPTPARLE